MAHYAFAPNEFSGGSTKSRNVLDDPPDPRRLRERARLDSSSTVAYRVLRLMLAEDSA